MFALTTITSPASDLIGPIFGSPAVFGAMLGVSVAALIVAVTFCGRPLGGRARIEDIAVLVIWLQVLRVLLQGAAVIAGAVSVFLAGIVLTAGSVLGLWIFVNFIDVAHGVGGLLKAGMILLLAMVGMMLGLSDRGDFTGKALEHYFNDTTDDPVNARRVVNGEDKALLIGR